MTHSDLDRERLVRDLARVASGDVAAMRALYGRTAAKLFGVCLSYTRDREAAEDVLQDVYVRVWNSAGRFDAARASPITWLATLARHAAIDWLRADGRRARLADLPPDTLEPEPGGDVLLAQAEERARVVACLDWLDDNQARCIRGAFFDGFSYPQLAQRQEVPLGTVKSWVRRGLLRLRECLGDA